MDGGGSEGHAAHRGLDIETANAVRAFVRRLRSRYLVIDAVVYGSRARSTHEEGSDADVAVVLEGDRRDRKEIVRDMAGIAFDIMMETDILVSPLPLWPDEFDDPSSFSNPELIAAIRRDGLRP